DKYTSASRAGTDGEASTGLGMSIVKELINLHDGEIEVNSVENHGTTFTITFPALNFKEKKPTESASADKPSLENMKKSKILIADDNRSNLRLLHKMLSKHGAEYITPVENGTEVIALYKESYHKQGFDIIITDIEMPKMNGDVAAEEIRSLSNSNTSPFIIALSGHKNTKFREGLFNKVLTKPVSLAHLQKALSYFKGR
ncbi:MAG: response regulator, partial [Lentisphaeraceae bacterium]|nr:response regulator [Lentisphaeraceae bacterium]